MKIKNVKEFITNRMVIIFLFSTFFFMLNMSISFAIVPVYLISNHYSIAQVGISATIYSLLSIIFKFILGPISDRKGRKFSMLIGAFSFVISWILIWHAPNFQIHLIARVLQAIGLAMFIPTATSVVSDMVDSNILGSCMGIYRGIFSFGIMLGPIYALTLSEISYSIMFIGIITTSLISFILITFISDTKSNTGNIPELKNYKKSIMLFNYIAVLKNPKLLRYYFAIITTSFCFGIVETNAAVFIRSLDNIMKPGIFLLFLGFFSTLASMIGGRLIDKIGIKKVIIPGAILVFIGILSMAFVQSTGNLALILVIIALGIGVDTVLISSIFGINRLASDDMKSTSFAAGDSAWDFGFAVGNMIFGFIVTGVGYSYGFLIISIIFTLCNICIFIWDFLYIRKIYDKV